MSSPTVELKKVSKSFSGVAALQDVSLQAFAGECLGLIGENGAGKSTLMKILSGVWPFGTFEGSIHIDGKSQKFSTPKEALDAGIAIIHQELALFKELSVAENIFMGDLPSKAGILFHEDLYHKAEELLRSLDFDLDPRAIVKSLSIGKQQLIEIAKAFRRPVKVLIFDEPTSALSDREVDQLMKLIDRLKERQVACVYISHKFNEIDRICDRVTILRDGQSIASYQKSEGFNHDQWIEAMVGRKISGIFPSKRLRGQQAKVIMQVRDLSYRDRLSKRSLLSGISFDLYEGEILGIAGLMGSKRTELLLALFGALDAEKFSGELKISGKKVEISSPAEAIANGLGLVTEDRKGSGLFLERSLSENLSLPILKSLSKFNTIVPQQEEVLVEYYCKVLRVKSPSAEALIKTLSGGNQQKVILGRWLSTKPKILMLDEPTRGIDVNAKSEIYHLIRQLVDQGLTLILVSSELPEVVSLSDRVLVMNQGRLAGTLSSDEISQEKIMERAVA